MYQVVKKLNYKKLLFIQLLGILHCIEEYFFGFPEWATRHFGTTTQNFYLLSHLVIALIIIIIAFYVYRGFKTGVFLVLILQTLIFTNGLFHIFTTILWKEYSPGVLAQVLIIPITHLVFKMVYQSNIFSKKQILYALILGSAISVAIILILFIDIPI